MGKWEYVAVALGVFFFALAAFLMAEGSILGERTIPAAVASLVVGISIIAVSARRRRTES